MYSKKIQPTFNFLRSLTFWRIENGVGACITIRITPRETFQVKFDGLGLLWCLGPSVWEWPNKKSPLCLHAAFLKYSKVYYWFPHTTPPPPTSQQLTQKTSVWPFVHQKKVHRWKFRSFSLSNSQERSWMNQPSHIPFTSKAFSNGSSIMFNVAMAHVMLASA